MPVHLSAFAATPQQFDALVGFLTNARMFSTYIIILAISLLRIVILRWIHRTHKEPSEERRRLIVDSRNFCVGLFLVGMVLVWASELRTFAVSLVAILAAIVLATKEVIMCLTGALVRSVSSSYKVGDRVEIGVVRGDVIDITPLATTLLEVGPGPTFHRRTGRTIVFPNSLLLTQPILNETKISPYIIHCIIVPVEAGGDWQACEKHLLEAAEAEVSTYSEELGEMREKFEQESGLDSPTSEPAVHLIHDEPGKVKLVLRYPVFSRRKGRSQDRVLRAYLAKLGAAKAAANAPA